MTPELVLVDPDLAARARAELADPPDCLAPRPRAEPRPEPVVSTTVDLAPPRPRPVAPPVSPLADPPLARRDVEPDPPLVLPQPVAPRRRRRLRAGTLVGSGTWAVVALFVLSPFLAFLPASESQLPTLVAPVSDAATPKPSEPKHPPVTLEWPASRDAVVYQVILVGGGERVHVWTEGTRLTLDDVAFQNAERRDYTWFAYPGFRDGKTVRYGDLAARGEVRVARAAIPKTQPPSGGQPR